LLRTFAVLWPGRWLAHACVRERIRQRTFARLRTRLALAALRTIAFTLPGALPAAATITTAATLAGLAVLALRLRLQLVRLRERSTRVDAASVLAGRAGRAFGGSCARRARRRLVTLFRH
jgi:hypothetical protein